MLAADPPTPQVLAISRGIQSPPAPDLCLGSTHIPVSSLLIATCTDTWVGLRVPEVQVSSLGWERGPHLLVSSPWSSLLSPSLVL